MDGNKTGRNMKCVEGLLEYFSELEKDFHHYYVNVLQRCEEEDVHQLRLNMKRQVAFFHLLEFLEPSFSTSKALEAYGKIYKKAGKVRDYQVEKKVVRREEELLKLQHHFSDWLAEQERKQRDKLQSYEEEHSLVRVHRLSKLVRNRLQYLPEDGFKSRLEAYFADLLAKVREIIAPEMRSEDHFHDLRKRIKVLYYNLALINSLCTKTHLAKRPMKSLDSFQKLLGNWHDRYFTLSRIEEGQEQCPEPLVARLKQEKADYAGKIERRLEKAPELVDRLEASLRRLLKTEPLEPGERPRSRKPKSKTRSSYSQVNVGERTK